MNRESWRDRLTRLWYRFTYCSQYGHKYGAYGNPEADDYCLNCGKDRP